MTRRVTVKSRAGSYTVEIGSGSTVGLAEKLTSLVPAHRYAVISDSNVAPLHGEGVLEALSDAGLSAEIFSFPAGERYKTRKTWSILTDAMLTSGLGRDTGVVGVGGGVTGDLAGFVAATFLRGVPFVQVPTSYLAMVDASVGGKVGVDTKSGKNLVGAFHPPRHVASDPLFLDTLPRRERSQGLVEAVKHGAILSAAHLAALDAHAVGLLAAEPGVAAETVADSVKLKAAVVEGDELEGGWREILNFGHTIAHAVEMASQYRVSHGRAVAWGMVVEARLGEQIGTTETGTASRLTEVLKRFEIDLGVGREVAVDALVHALAADKKTRRGQPRFVLLRRIGEVARSEDGTWSRAVSEPAVRSAIERC